MSCHCDELLVRESARPAAARPRLRASNEIFDQLRDIPNRLRWSDQATAG